MRNTFAVAAAIAASVLLVGCSPDRGATPGSSDSPTPAVSATSVPTTASPDTTAGVVTPSPAAPESEVVVPPSATTTRKAQEPSVGSQVVLTTIRTASHPGVDRVVLEFSGSGTPGWDVEYVAKATSQGSGNDVEVVGSSILRITATGTTYPEPNAPFAAKRFPGDGQGLVTEVINDSTFEGRTVVFVGLSSEKKPFDVQVMQSPTRLVVDIVR